MKIRKTFALPLLTLFAQLGAANAETPPPSIESHVIQHQRILYLMQAGQTSEAIALYQKYHQQLGHHDFELIQQIGLTLLDQGYRSDNAEIQLLTIFGSGISANEKALYILEKGVASPIPQLQLISLNLLSKFQNDSSDYALNYAMRSNYLLIRLETAYILAEKKHPSAVFQADSLMGKVDPEFVPLFPQIFAMAGDSKGIKILRRLLTHPNEKVRIEAILQTAQHERDDLLPVIRTLASQHSVPQQEACAWALGQMKDESSFERLDKLSRSSAKTVRLAALQAEYSLGRKEVYPDIVQEALAEDLFAIHALAKLAGSEDTLFQLSRSKNIQVRINACLGLLERQDPRSLQMLGDILIKDSRDLACLKVFSPGKAFAAWKVVPSAKQNLSDIPIAYELSLTMREMTLSKAVDLPEEAFLKIAAVLFELQQNDLIPTLTSLLENMATPSAIALLKTFQQKAGAPLIRNYCNLSLYRLKEPGPYGDNLKEWIAKQQGQDIIQFRPFIPWEMRDKDNSYQLTPQETSRLLIESFEAFARSQDDKGLEVLLNAIQNGNPKNKYALAGLLLRAIQ